MFIKKKKKKINLMESILGNTMEGWDLLEEFYKHLSNQHGHGFQLNVYKIILTWQ